MRSKPKSLRNAVIAGGTLVVGAVVAITGFGEGVEPGTRSSAQIDLCLEQTVLEVEQFMQVTAGTWRASLSSTVDADGACADDRIGTQTVLFWSIDDGVTWGRLSDGSFEPLDVDDDLEAAQQRFLAGQFATSRGSLVESDEETGALE